MSVEAFWREFVAARGDIASESTPYTAWHFCDNEADADELAELVLAGKKRATAGALWSYEAEGEALPQPGDCSVVTDWRGVPRCVIRTTAVEVVPFAEVTEEFAATEGEGDGSLRYWREGHERYFRREMAAIGQEFGPGLPVVCERFEVVYPASDGTGGGRD